METLPPHLSRRTRCSGGCVGAETCLNLLRYCFSLKQIRNGLHWLITSCSCPSLALQREFGFKLERRRILVDDLRVRASRRHAELPEAGEAPQGAGGWVGRTLFGWPVASLLTRLVGGCLLRCQRRGRRRRALVGGEVGVLLADSVPSHIHLACTCLAAAAKAAHFPVRLQHPSPSHPPCYTPRSLPPQARCLSRLPRPPLTLRWAAASPPPPTCSHTCSPATRFQVGTVELLRLGMDCPAVLPWLVLHTAIQQAEVAAMPCFYHRPRHPH